MRRVLRAVRELDAAQLELAELLPTTGDDERDLAAFITHDFKPRLRVIDGGPA